MIYLENKLIKSINCQDEKLALSIYEKLYTNFKKYDIGNGCYLRSLKNHLLSLNCILYKKSYSNPICKKILYEKRIFFIMEVEKQVYIESLYLIGKDIIIFYSNIFKDQSLHSKNIIISEAILYIHSYLDQDLTLQKVSKAIHISPNYLSCLFSKYIGSSFSEYINQIKIDKSKLLLKNTSLSLLHIAMECGFNSQSYFCYVFKNLENITPRQYKAGLRSN